MPIWIFQVHELDLGKLMCGQEILFPEPLAPLVGLFTMLAHGLTVECQGSLVKISSHLDTVLAHPIFEFSN